MSLVYLGSTVYVSAFCKKDLAIQPTWILSGL